MLCSIPAMTQKDCDDLSYHSVLFCNFYKANLHWNWNFQNARVFFPSQARTRNLSHQNGSLCHWDNRCSIFTIWYRVLFVCKCSTYFNPWWIFHPSERLTCANKTCFAGVVPRRKLIFLTKNSFSFVSMWINFFQKFLSAHQTSIPGVNQVFSPSQFLKGFWFLFCDRKFFDRLKRLFVVPIPCVTVYQENSDHTRSTPFCWRYDEVEMRGTCLNA